jgi:hypothetical protein
MAAPAAPICSENSCQECTLSFSTKFNLKRHMLRKHPALEGEKNSKICEKDIPICEKDIPICEKDIPICEKDIPICEKDIPHENRCDKCNKILACKRNLKYHILKCSGKINILQCGICKEIFTCPSNKYKHQKKCKLKEYAQITNIQIQNNIITNINNNSGIQININNFGSENKDYITKEFLLKCFENGGYGVGAMVDKIYFDENHPENHNVKLGSLRHSYVDVRRNAKWQPQGLDNTLSNMIQTASSDIICNKDMPGELDEKNIDLYTSITNLDPKIEKRIKENSKGKLIARRRDNE